MADKTTKTATATTPKVADDPEAKKIMEEAAALASLVRKVNKMTKDQMQQLKGLIERKLADNTAEKNPLE